MKRVYRLYRDGLDDVAQVRVLPFNVDDGESPQWIDAIVERRDALVGHLLALNIHCRPFWFPVHTQAPYLRSDAAFPESSRWMPRAVWLPSALSLSDDDVQIVCQQIRDFYIGDRA